MQNVYLSHSKEPFSVYKYISTLFAEKKRVQRCERTREKDWETRARHYVERGNVTKRKASILEFRAFAIGRMPTRDRDALSLQAYRTNNKKKGKGTKREIYNRETEKKYNSTDEDIIKCHWKKRQSFYRPTHFINTTHRKRLVDSRLL